MRVFASICLILCLGTSPTATAEITGLLIVRHAEKADDGTRDPGLTSAGRIRAEALADTVMHSKVGGLIASQYLRTQQTLSVLAQRRGLEITVAPAASGEIEAHVDTIASMVRDSQAEGLMVIAGHSNTVPLIVEALSGQVVDPIEESEYDRLYLLVPAASGMEVIASRYGAGSDQAED